MSTDRTPPAMRVRLVVPHVDGRRVLATGADLPSLDVVADPTTLAAAVARLPDIGLSGPVIESVIDFTRDEELDGAREAVMQLVPHDDAAADGDRRWIDWAELEPVVPHPLARVTSEIIGERRGELEPHPDRVAWARHGWYDAASTWIRRSLRDVGRAEPDAVVQFRHWGISAVMRVDAPDGRSWFKASYPRFAHEGPVTAHLAATLDAGVPSVVAVDADQGWMLVDDLGPTETADVVDQAAAVDLLVSIQAAQAVHTDTLVELGCPLRPVEGLAAELDEALGSAVVADAELTESERRDLVAAVERASDRLVDLGLPSTLVHGDFHPGNTTVTTDGPVIFDWTDASVSSPVVDFATWAWWYEHDDERQAMIWRSFSEAWQRHLGVGADALDRSTVDIVAGAFHAAGYIRLVEALEPRRRFENAAGPRHFIELIRRSIA